LLNVYSTERIWRVTRRQPLAPAHQTFASATDPAAFHTGNSVIIRGIARPAGSVSRRPPSSASRREFCARV